MPTLKNSVTIGISSETITPTPHPSHIHTAVLRLLQSEDLRQKQAITLNNITKKTLKAIIVISVSMYSLLYINAKNWFLAPTNLIGITSRYERHVITDNTARITPFQNKSLLVL